MRERLREEGHGFGRFPARQVQIVEQEQYKVQAAEAEKKVETQLAAKEKASRGDTFTGAEQTLIQGVFDRLIARAVLERVVEGDTFGRSPS